MAGKNIRRRRANKRAIILGVIVLAVISVIFIIQAIRLHRENEILEKQKAAYEEKYEKLKEFNTYLEENKDKELTREELIEIARDRFGLVFPDEIYMIPEE